MPQDFTRFLLDNMKKQTEQMLDLMKFMNDLKNENHHIHKRIDKFRNRISDLEVLLYKNEVGVQHKV